MVSRSQILIALQRTYDLQWVAIEQDKIGKAIGAFLKEKVVNEGVPMSLIPITPSADKQMRIRSIQARMRAGGLKFDKTLDAYVDLESEFLQFPRGRHDDQVDAFSCIGLGLDKMTAAQTLQEQQDDEYEDDLRTTGTIFGGRSAVTGY